MSKVNRIVTPNGELGDTLRRAADLADAQQLENSQLKTQLGTIKQSLAAVETVPTTPAT